MTPLAATLPPPNLDENPVESAVGNTRSLFPRVEIPVMVAFVVKVAAPVTANVDGTVTLP
jgi:hypothetical protein